MPHTASEPEKQAPRDSSSGGRGPSWRLRAKASLCRVSTCRSQAQPGSCPTATNTHGRGLQGPQQRACAPPTQAPSRCPRRLQTLPGQRRPEQRRLCPQGGRGRGCQCPTSLPGSQTPHPKGAQDTPGRGRASAGHRGTADSWGGLARVGSGAPRSRCSGLVPTASPAPMSSCKTCPRSQGCVHPRQGGRPRAPATRPWTGPAGLCSKALCSKAEQVRGQPARRRGHRPSPQPLRTQG